MEIQSFLNKIREMLKKRGIEPRNHLNENYRKLKEKDENNRKRKVDIVKPEKGKKL